MGDKKCIKLIALLCKFIKMLCAFFSSRSFGHILGLIALYIAYTQSLGIIHELQSENYNRMNERYVQLYKEFPETFSKENKNVETKHNLARRYFNLWSDEYHLCKKGHVTKELMNAINHGACVNLQKYPDLVKSYDYWKKLNTFGHSKDLMYYIETIIYRAKNNNCVFKPTKECSIGN